MQAHVKLWKVREMARVLGVSASGYYKYSRSKPSIREKENHDFLKEIRDIYTKSRGTYGSPRVHAELVLRGKSCSRPRVARLMHKAGIQAKMQRPFRKTTTVDKTRPVAANVLARDFTAVAPNEKWVSDISYIYTLSGFLYLAVIIDLFSRKVVGMAMSETLQTPLVLRALQQALTRRSPEGEVMHHSDRGCQYTSYDFQGLLAENNMTCSMSGTGNCYDNAVAESFFHTLKTECVYHERYENRQQAEHSIFEYVEVFYNNQRRHSTLGYLSPAEFERQYVVNRSF